MGVSSRDARDVKLWDSSCRTRRCVMPAVEHGNVSIRATPTGFHNTPASKPKAVYILLFQGTIQTPNKGLELFVVFPTGKLGRPVVGSTTPVWKHNSGTRVIMALAGSLSLIKGIIPRI